MPNRSSLLLRNSTWMAISRVGTVLVKLVTVPLLLGHYGKADYGLVVLAFSFNSYLQITALGLPGGLERHAAAWLGTGQREDLYRASRTSVTLLTALGLVNGLVLLALAGWGADYFRVPPESLPVFRRMLLVAALSNLVYWPTSIINQLLSAAEEIAWLQKLRLGATLLELGLVLAVIHHGLSIEVYFAGTLLLLHAAFPFKLVRWRRHAPLWATLRPGWAWRSVRPVMLYGVGLFVITAAQLSAMELRPVILGLRSGDGVAAAADFRVLFVITNFVLMIRTWFTRPLLPAASKAVARGDDAFINRIIFDVTRYVWVLTAFPIAMGLVGARRVLEAYVGPDFAHLWPWLSLWLLAFSVMYLGPVSSVLLAQGRLRSLALYTVAAAALALSVGWVLAPRLNVGGVVVGTVVFYLLHVLFYHAYYLPIVMCVNPLRLVRTAFLPPFVAAAVTGALTHLAMQALHLPNPWLWLAVAGTIGGALYAVLTTCFVIRPRELLDVLRKVRER